MKLKLSQMTRDLGKKKNTQDHLVRANPLQSVDLMMNPIFQNNPSIFNISPKRIHQKIFHQHAPNHYPKETISTLISIMLNTSSGSGHPIKQAAKEKLSIIKIFLHYPI
jgi:hypothetical protein